MADEKDKKEEKPKDTLDAGKDSKSTDAKLNVQNNPISEAAASANRTPTEKKIAEDKAKAAAETAAKANAKARAEETREDKK